MKKYNILCGNNIDSLKDECEIHLITILSNFDKSRGSKAFSYFSIVAKNYLILHNNNNYKKMKSHDKIEKLDFVRNISSEKDLKETKEFNVEFVSQMLDYWDNNITNIFRRQKDILVLFHEICSNNGNNITPPITIQYIASNLSDKVGTILSFISFTTGFFELIDSPRSP